MMRGGRGVERVVDVTVAVFKVAVVGLWLVAMTSFVGVF
jgi:hypothetical protein